MASKPRARSAWACFSLAAFGAGCAEPVPDSAVGSGMGGTVSNPIDDRPVVRAARTPPPLSGGTLIALRDATRAVLADPDRDRIVVVDTLGMRSVFEFPLEAGAEPGRLVEDGAGRVHIVLRGKGEIVGIDPRSGAMFERRPLCQAPRGIAFDAANDSLVVACLEGDLIELPAAGGAAFQKTRVAPDLRDVVMVGAELAVTRFRSVEVLFLDAERNVTKRVTPLSTDSNFAATTAWRAIAAPSGQLVITHQRALEGEVGISQSSSDGSSSPYGNSADPCASIVQGTLTMVSSQGEAVTHQTLPNTALPLDVAVSTRGLVAVANGAFDPQAFTLGQAQSFVVFDSQNLFGRSGDCGTGAATVDQRVATATSVAFDANGRLLVQFRQPSELRVYDQSFGVSVVALGGTDVTDTGHAAFHSDTGSNIACASCHAEGGDDGHVWKFGGLGPRRSQPLDVGLEGTAPFHWDGELATFGDLVHEVFQRRMGGSRQSSERSAELERYVYGFKRRPALHASDDEAALRGKALFESPEVACATCHTGPKLTNGETEDIGKGAGTQVPSLVGVSTRAPYMHDGCAATLRDRFDPACGGTKHGHAEILDETALGDLIAYLESL
jgi:mono/diheme cytochrome c family protein